MLCHVLLKPLRHTSPFSRSSFPWTMNFRAWYWKWLSWICFTNSESRAQTW